MKGVLSVHFEDIALILSKSNVSRFVVGLRHFTRNVSAICVVCVVVDDAKQHAKFQERPSTSHGCETAGSKQCLIAGVPGLVTNS